MTLTTLLDAMRSDARPFTYAEITRCASNRGIAAALRRGDMVPVLPNYYAADLHAESWHVRLQAAVAAVGPGVVTGPSALRLRGLEAVRDDTVHLMVPRATRRRPPEWLRLRRSDLELPHDVLWRLPTHAGGVALAIGHGMVAPRLRAELVFGAFREGLVSIEEVGAALSVLPRVAGRRFLERRAVAAASGVHSFLEERAWGTVLNTTLGREMLRQHRVRVAARGFRLDAFHAPTRTAVEFDGARWHAGQERERDTVRDALLATVGVLVVRLRYEDVMQRPLWCREVVRLAIAARPRCQPEW